jgi:cytidine deaminase
VLLLKHYDVNNPKPEFVVGLSGPVGTDLRSVASILAQELRAYHYHSVQIRVSELLQEWCSDEVRSVIRHSKEDERINQLMNVGDLMRARSQSGAGAMPLVASAIRRSRQKTLLDEGCNRDYFEVELYNYCYIVNSLKHPDEVSVLRSIYGTKFIMISVVLPEGKRKANLQAKIAKSYNDTNENKYASVAERLIDKDRKRENNDIGQNIGGTFHLADFFVRGDECVESDVRRMFRIIFGHPNSTPTKNEFVMFEARSNALRSADLSRQVGAVITNPRLEIISRGCNEVPVPGGDTHWPDDRNPAPDTRDYESGKDYNAVKKVEVLRELLDFLLDNSIVTAQPTNNPPDESRPTERLTNALVYGDHKSAFKDLRVSNLIEFGRMVHAEMFALMEAARRGLSVADGTLYCTTFPCHMCARHIIAAGIREVIYIEPYPKSMTKDLYGDMIRIDAAPKDVEQSRRRPRPPYVYFMPFHGTAPRIFREAFEMTKRKDDRGYSLPFDEENVLPKWIPLSKAHLDLETAFAATLSALPLVKDVTAVTAEI